jgi:hypothetical protein
MFGPGTIEGLEALAPVIEMVKADGGGSAG